MQARSKLALVTLAAGVLLAGCSSDTTSPEIARPVASQLRSSPFVPTAAAKALVGVADGTYQFTVDPTVDQEINLGPNRLSLPANAICDIATSSYGAGHWDESCVPQTEPVQITAVVKNATTDHPSIDFYPAMRFNPDKNVGLYIYVVTDEMSEFQKSWVMNYCDDEGTCVDESVADSSLRTFADAEHNMVFRRVKHFSGFLVLQIVEPVTDLLGL